MKTVCIAPTRVVRFVDEPVPPHVENLSLQYVERWNLYLRGTPVTLGKMVPREEWGEYEAEKTRAGCDCAYGWELPGMLVPLGEMAFACRRMLEMD